MTPLERARRCWWSEGIPAALARLERDLSGAAPECMRHLFRRGLLADGRLVTSVLDEGDYPWFEAWLTRLDLAYRLARERGRETTYLVQCVAHTAALRDEALRVFLERGGAKLLSGDEARALYPTVAAAAAAARGGAP